MPILILEERRASPDPLALAASGLTPREIQVLALMARGDTNKAIGRALSISPRTVQKHIEHINEKLGVGTRTAAVTRGAELSAADAR